MIPPKRFDIPPLTGGCSEGLDAIRFFFKHNHHDSRMILITYIYMYNGINKLIECLRCKPMVSQIVVVRPDGHSRAEQQKNRRLG